MNKPPLPWQDSQWQQLEARIKAGRLPHALLLRGPVGVGKHIFAQHVAGALLCERAPARCGKCRSCHLFGVGNHPDYLSVSPLEEKRTIAIDQIRELIAAVSLTSQLARYQVAILSPAEAMTTPAANALLKTLEEPPGDTVFLLVSHQAALLPVTVRSRCQSIDFPTPPTAAVAEWLGAEIVDQDQNLLLAIAGGAPLTALDLAEKGAIAQRDTVFQDVAALVSGEAGPIAVAARWYKQGMRSVVPWLMSFATDLIRLKMLTDPPVLTHPDHRPSMRKITDAADIQGLFRALDSCAEAGRVIARSLNLNEQLLLEGLAIEWQSLARPNPGGR